MNRRRAWLAGALAITSAVGGMTVISAAPAAAAAGNTTMTCERVENDPDAGGIPTFHCVIADPDGIRTIGYHYGPEADYHGTDGFWGEFCGDPDFETTSTGYTFYPALRTKFFITDCDQPRNRSTFVVRNDGTVKEIRNN